MSCFSFLIIDIGLSLNFIVIFGHCSHWRLGVQLGKRSLSRHGYWFCSCIVPGFPCFRPQCSHLCILSLPPKPVTFSGEHQTDAQVVMLRSCAFLLRIVTEWVLKIVWLVQNDWSLCFSGAHLTTFIDNLKVSLCIIYDRPELSS